MGILNGSTEDEEGEFTYTGGREKLVIDYVVGKIKVRERVVRKWAVWSWTIIRGEYHWKGEGKVRGKERGKKRKKEVNGQRGEEKGLGRAWNETLERIEVDEKLEIKTGLEKIGR